MKFFKDIFTEPDGESFELLAALGTVAFFVAIGLTIYVTVKNNNFDIINFGLGTGALIGSISAGQKFKPQAKEKNEQQ